MKTFPELKSRRLRLRAVGEQDYDFYFEMLHNEDVLRYTDVPHKPSRKRSEAFVNWMMRLFPRGKGCAWLIETPRAGKPLGAIRINSIHKRTRVGVVGYELHPDAWGKGLMSEALSLIVPPGHADFGIHRMEAWTLPGNPGSDRVLQRNGFVYEGTSRAKIYFNGKFLDVRNFARLPND